MVEIDWLIKNCIVKNLSIQRINIFGRYAVNADGDLMVMNDESQFVYITSAEISSSYFDYDAFLENIICTLDDNSTRVYYDIEDLCRAYKEAVLRNKFIDSAKIGVTNDSPVRLIYDVTELIHSWNDYDTEHHHTKVIPGFYEDKDYGMGDNIYSNRPVCKLSLPKRYEKKKGYRFALKVVNINDFCNLFGFIGFSDQRTPFEMMHDLEQSVTKNWKEYGIVFSTYNIDYLGDKLVIFEFSHFELDVDEPDETYRCFHACYCYVGTVKI